MKKLFSIIVSAQVKARRRDSFFKARRQASGRIVLETAFVFAMLTFLVFAIVNFAIIFHTKNVATYAAFMAARSFQVMGDLDRGKDKNSNGPDLDVFEVLQKDKKPSSFMEGAKTATPYQVAEDIFTCALPWVTLPEGESSNNNAGKDVPFARCQEGKRPYKNLNVGDSIRFQPFGDSQNPLSALLGGGNDSTLNKVDKGFREEGRTPLQYGILKMNFRKSILFNPLGLFSPKPGESTVFVDEVYVPVLLNPGLNIEFEQDQGQGKKFEEEAANTN